jgi:hypothetical protein
MGKLAATFKQTVGLVDEPEAFFDSVLAGEAGRKHAAAVEKLATVERDLSESTQRREELKRQIRAGTGGDVQARAAALLDGKATEDRRAIERELEEAAERVRILEAAVGLQRDRVRATLRERNAAISPRVRDEYVPILQRTADALRELSAAIAAEERFREAGSACEAFCIEPAGLPERLANDLRADHNWTAASEWLAEVKRVYKIE